MTKPMEQNIYLGGDYIEKNPLYHVEDSPWKASQILKMLDRHDLQVASVCEIGCGAGEILRQLQLQMPDEVTFHGYEISPRAFDLCKQRQNERLLFYCEDLLSKETEPFDLLLCIDVFEHVEDHMGFLRQLRHKGVHKVFHIPLEITANAAVRGKPFVAWREELGHLHFFTKDTALLTLEETGYEIVDFFYTPAGIERAQTVKQRVAKLPRRVLSAISQDFAVRALGGYSLLVLAR
jgi:2-polyprenyl-3-methyl-5-hydroxy-6-metoxy-1,4-benzoquinol methylase